MSCLYKTQDIVKEILTEHPFTRNSDNKLYIEVCRKVNPEVEHWLFFDALTYQSELGIPCFETVRRTRQKLQAMFPELAADSNVESGRMLREEEFRDYARRKW